MAKQKPIYSNKDEQLLMSELFDPQIVNDPEAFALFAFPWGKEGTPLQKHKGPRSWQRDEMQAIADHVKNNLILIKNKKPPKVYKSATASGRGIGKSALVSMLNIWHMSCHIGATGVITANNETQLKSRTFAELGKWKALAINSHWFELSAMRFFPAEWFSKIVERELKIDSTYNYCDAQLWSEENPDAFAGLHNDKGVMLTFDEGSGISSNIWDVSDGFFTEESAYHFWLAFSNPRRNTGAFFECFHKHRKYWKRRQVDSRTVEGVNKETLNEIIERHGEDSYQARVEVKGLFPLQGARQFIARHMVMDAIEREDINDDYAGLIMGVDIARYGDDETVICFRQGRNARIIPAVKLMGKDNMQVANICAELINKYAPNAVCIDAGGGTGVIDRLRELGFKIKEIWFGGKSDSEEYRDKRTELWGKMKNWIQGACLPDDSDLMDDLCSPEYDFDPRSEKLFLESKESLKKRGLASPDYGDALACTFFVNVSRSDIPTSRKRTNRVASGIDYDIFG